MLRSAAAILALALARFAVGEPLWVAWPVIFLRLAACLASAALLVLLFAIVPDPNEARCRWSHRLALCGATVFGCLLLTRFSVDAGALRTELNRRVPPGTTRQDVRRFFEQRGVQWEEGFSTGWAIVHPSAFRPFSREVLEARFDFTPDGRVNQFSVR